MDFELSDRAKELQANLLEYMAAHVYPAEPVWAEQIAASGDPHFVPPVLDELQAEARRRGLWNLFLPHKTQWTDGLSNVDYAPLAEIMGRSAIAPQALNCSAPDTGNMELLTLFGTEEQQGQWLAPLLEGETWRARTPRTSRCGSSAMATVTSSTAGSGGSPASPTAAASWPSSSV
jgi:acyl-CoA dehydrogenase